MKRQVFFSFEFNKDAWRAAQVRNMGVVNKDSTASDNDWEHSYRKQNHLHGNDTLLLNQRAITDIIKLSVNTAALARLSNF